MSEERYGVTNTVNVSRFDERVVLVTPLNIAAAIRETKRRFERGEVNGIQLDDFQNFRGFDLTFLKEFSYIERLAIGTDDVGPLDLTVLPNLRELTFTSHAKTVGLNKLARLRILVVFKLPGKNLVGALPDGLEDLTIRQSRIESLDGIEALKNLKRCELSFMPKLIDISALGSMDESLREIEMKSARHISSYEALGRLSNLTILVLEGCAEISDIHWLRSLTSLQRFVFLGTRIQDGDLSIVFNMPNLKAVYGGHLKHYRPSMKEIEAHFNEWP